MDNYTLKKLQDTELEILTVLDNYCRKHDIKYSIYAGTLLGAVRHRGFIPWDDDIDVAMTRDEYTKFCNCIMKNPIDGYIFTNFEIDMDSLTCHGKLGKLGTVFLQEGDIESIGHHEIWVDIFPIDKLAANGKKRSEIMKLGRELILLSRANGHRTNDSFKKKIVRFSIRMIPRKYRFKKMISNLNRLKQLNTKLKDNYEWTSMSTIENISKIRFPKSMMEKYTEIDFEGIPFMAVDDYEGMLKILFNDYMKLPPKDEQICKHNPVKVIF